MKARILLIFGISLLVSGIYAMAFPTSALACKHQGGLYVKNTSGTSVSVKVHDGKGEPSHVFPPGHDSKIDGICISNNWFPPGGRDYKVSLRNPNNDAEEWRSTTIAFLRTTTFQTAAFVIDCFESKPCITPATINIDSKLQEKIKKEEAEMKKQFKKEAESLN